MKSLLRSLLAALWESEGGGGGSLNRECELFLKSSRLPDWSARRPK